MVTVTRAPSGATRRPRAIASPVSSPRATARAVSRAASTVRIWAIPTESNHTSPMVTATRMGSTIASSAVTAPRSDR